ncbi:MAG TPA: hypothetical protein VK722_13210 [Candidatus Aquilonibacter sp.]|jgi:hypothetical protein|nr:hypothetical protein [Candidatus Aquilonibacter sp.]
MSWKKVFVLCGLIFLLQMASACSRHRSGPEVIVEIPAGFSGNFELKMGVNNTPALTQLGSSYVVTVPKSGNLSTSTLLQNPHTVFKNFSGTDVWGYSNSIFTTGDGIPVGGKIEFFVGTQKDYEAFQDKKNHSNEFLRLKGLPAAA